MLDETLLNDVSGAGGQAPGLLSTNDLERKGVSEIRDSPQFGYAFDGLEA